MKENLWCEARIEQNMARLGVHGVAHMDMPQGEIRSVKNIGNSLIFTVVRL